MSSNLSIARSARTFFRSGLYGVLSTHSVELEGYPFGSVTPFATTPEGELIIFVSMIAQHTKNMTGNPKVSLMAMDRESEDKQASARVTFVGDALRVEGRDEEMARSRYLALFPGHVDYFQTHDFVFFKIKPVRVRYIGGFGRIHWIPASDWLLSSPQWAAEEQEIIRHMNEDHQDALLRMAGAELKTPVQEAQMVSLDPDGFHITTERGSVYLVFSSPCVSTDQVRAEMIRLAKESRKIEG
jgi:putative heme iron utilization protein